MALASSLGALTPITLTTDSQGAATAIFSAGDVVGTATVTATLGSVTATLPVTITSGAPAGLTLAAQPRVIASGGGRAVVTATVYADGGGPVNDGHRVSFSVSLGTVAPDAVLTRGGLG